MSRKSWYLCSVLTRIISREHNLNRWPLFQTKTILPVQENSVVISLSHTAFEKLNNSLKLPRVHQAKDWKYIVKNM